MPTEVLTGFGFCAFQNLEAAQKCRFDIQKELFRGVYKVYANPFEWKELRAAHKMERIDQLEGQVHNLQDILRTMAAAQGNNLDDVRGGKAQNLKDREILEFLGD